MSILVTGIAELTTNDPARGDDAGTPLSLGSDQHVVIDPFEELRGVEMHERLVTNAVSYTHLTLPTKA